MIVAHLSDLHLGFRAYGRMEDGVDVRERDVAAAFERSCLELLRLEPAVIIIAGDVFDRPDPPAAAVVTLARGLETLRAGLPESPVLMVSGPRDTPRRRGDPGALAAFDTFPNVEAATGLVRSVLFEQMSLHACLVPHRALTALPPPPAEPDPRMRWNLLVLHAEALSGSPPCLEVDPDEWSYVGLGGRHRRESPRPTVRYSGSLERVALDPWEEAADEKGFLTVDLESGRTEFHPIPGRPVVALAPVKVRQRDPERLRRKVREVTDEVPGGIAGKIVRLRLDGADPDDLLALQGEMLQELRAEALHLAVEAGREPRVPAQAWLPVDAPARLREAVTAELDRDGLLDPSIAEVVEAAVFDGEDGSGGLPAALDIEGGGDLTLEGDAGRIPPGLTAVVGGGGRERRAVFESAVRRVPDGTPDSMKALWRGSEMDALDGAWRVGVAAVAHSRGAGAIALAMERLGVGGDAGTVHREPEATADTRPTSGAVRVDPEQVAAEFRAAERELLASRADVVEVDGDLEVATMEWLRERQDAETTLQAYRDRARELQGRIRSMESAGPESPCPTCGRVLASHYESVLADLKDQWESVVQDGSWWRARREQLEMKPESLRETEGRSLMLHATVEAGSERVELLRTRLQELAARAPSSEEVPTGTVGVVATALQRLYKARVARAADVLGRRASRFVCRMSGGRILALSREGDSIHLEGSQGVLNPTSEEDLAAAKLAIRLAAASLIAAAGKVLKSLAIEEPFDRLDEESQIRTLILLRELVVEIPRLMLVTRGEVVDARPELLDHVLEVPDEGGSDTGVRGPSRAGPGRVSLRAAALPEGRGVQKPKPSQASARSS